MLAKKITLQRINHLEPSQKVEFKKLSEIALVEVSKNYLLYPELKNLDPKHKLRVYDLMSVDSPVDITFPLIDYEPYWERACKKDFGLVDCSQNGNCWKQCYAENYVKKLITNFDISKGDKMEIIIKYLELFRYHVFNLDIPTFSADFEIDKIPQHFVNLTSLELKYSPILRENKKQNLNIFNKQLTPINDEYSKFGMRMVDLKHFSISLNNLNYLFSLTLQGNFLDDDMVIWLVSGLISNHSIRILDLSNNKITDSGLIKLSSYLIRTTCLMSLDLTNNTISGEGGFAISLVLKENTRLKVLKLGMNKIDDLNASKIIHSLGKNEYLEELDLSSNNLGDMCSSALSYCFKTNKRLKILDLSYSQILLDSEAKNSLEQHPCLIKLDLHITKCSEEEVKSIESILIRKSVKQNLAYKKLNKN